MLSESRLNSSKPNFPSPEACARNVERNDVSSGMDLKIAESFLAVDRPTIIDNAPRNIMNPPDIMLKKDMKENWSDPAKKYNTPRPQTKRRNFALSCICSWRVSTRTAGRNPFPSRMQMMKENIIT
mmetsp:Transcript_40809/g.59646  ORF Transcript_40809/g.59646 Transcript_40809/m.59646 type:complete len:126 (-) Transcript_40809:382-759(-)